MRRKTRQAGAGGGRRGAARGKGAGQGKIDALEHAGRKRVSIPTEQTERDIDHEGNEYRPKARAQGGEPRLQWDRRLPRPGGEYAHALHIREKFSPRDMVERLSGSAAQSHIFDAFNGFEPPGAKFMYYSHRSQGNWQNRLIRGDSARVMASLARLEGYAGEVQTIFFDPPYGIGFDSNFVCALRGTNRSKKLGGDGARPRDPVSVKAFCDTWERGMDSYLDAILHRLAIMRDLLAESGSIFVQIGPDNVHRMAILLDEVFGHENSVTTITFRKSGGTSSSMIPEGSDFILWYARDRKKAGKKYRQLYESLDRGGLVMHMSWHGMVEEPGKKPRNISPDEKADVEKIPAEARLLQRMPLTSMGWSKTRSFDYEWNGKTYQCPPSSHWSVSKNGLDHLARIGRLIVSPRKEGGGWLRWKRYENEIPGKRINNQWVSTPPATNPRYPVQTSEEVVKRCILMSSDPGDLVLDPSGGSGATAVVAERYGRRWVMIDSSHVSIATMRHHLAMQSYDWYMLQDSAEGADAERDLGGKPQKAPYRNDPALGFVYERCPYVSAAALAYDEKTEPVLLVDKPVVQRGVRRVTGPFTVESETSSYTLSRTDPGAQAQFAAQVIGVLEQNGISDPDRGFVVANIAAAPADRAYTHTGTISGRRGALFIAPEFGAVDNRLINAAASDAAADKIDTLAVVSFEFQPLIAKTPARVRVVRVSMNRALQQRELASTKIDRAFVVVGEPNIRVERAEGAHSKWMVEIAGYNTYDPCSGNTGAGRAGDIDCWMIDTDYDGESFYARDVHFPSVGATWSDRQAKNIEKLLGSRVDRQKWEKFASLKSAPFSSKTGKIAVKIITTTGDEMAKEITLAAPERRGSGRSQK